MDQKRSHAYQVFGSLLVAAIVVAVTVAVVIAAIPVGGLDDDGRGRGRGRGGYEREDNSGPGG